MQVNVSVLDGQFLHLTLSHSFNERSEFAIPCKLRSHLFNIKTILTAFETVILINPSPTSDEIARFADLSNPFIHFIHTPHFAFDNFEVLDSHPGRTEHRDDELQGDWRTSPGLLLVKCGDQIDVGSEHVLDAARESTDLPNNSCFRSVVLRFAGRHHDVAFCSVLRHRD